MFVLLTGGLEARPAFDPIAFFIAIVIIFNVVASIVAAARKRAAKSQDAQTQVRLDVSLQQSRERVETVRAAQLAKLREALAASRAAQQASVSGSPVARAPILVTATAAATITLPAPARPAPSLSVASLTPPSAPVADTTFLQTPATLASFDFGALPLPNVTGPQVMQPVGLPGTATRQVPLAVLQGQRIGANLFIAAAIVGPCAAFRTLGHTPGGW